ncbi:MAG TPA: hypothetical protein VFT44_00080, partial [Pyrinomonadaceae bacterium]|nr:hypothetical protein [Pyrinomonadaceae bacterium]
DETLGSGTKAGYTISCPDGNLTAGPPATFFATAIPEDTGLVTRTGNRSFVISEDGIVRGKVIDTAAPSHADAIDSTKWPALN